MDNNSLFTTRQLTEHREWPDGRKGSLIYVPNDDSSFAGRGAVYLIECSRKESVLIPAPIELTPDDTKQLTETNKIVGGFWAFLMTAGCQTWVAQTEKIEQHWITYCKHYNPYDEDYFCWGNLHFECLYWIARDKTILNEYLKSQHLPMSLNYMAHQMIRWKLGRRLFNTALSLWDFQPHIRFADLESGPKHFKYASFNKYMRWFERADTNAIVLYGFQASLLNHAATKHVLNEFWKEKDLDSGIPILLKRLHNPESELNITDIVIPFYISAREKLQDVYIEGRLSDVEKEVTGLDEYRLGSEKEQEQYKLHYIFKKEMEEMNYNQAFLQYMTQEQQKKMRKLTGDFFVSLLVRLKESPFYPTDYTTYTTCFSEQRHTQQTQRQLKDTDRPRKEDLEKIFSFTFRRTLQFELLIDMLKMECDKASDSDWARYALTIYQANILQNKPRTYKIWLNDFCNLFGRVWVRYYEPNKLGRSNKSNKIACFIP